jgi:hypothetical protein
VETNNVSLAVPITLTVPDLVPVGLSAPASGVSGRSISIVYALSNQGNGIAFSSWADRLYLSTNATFEAQDYRLGESWQTQPVTNATSYTFTNTATLPLWSAGTYYVILQADCYNYVFESVETNNLGAAVPIVLIWTNLAPILAGPQRLSDGAIDLLIYGAIGTNYELQVSTNLFDWTAAWDFICTNSPMRFRDEVLTNGAGRFYRGALP